MVRTAALRQGGQVVTLGLAVLVALVTPLLPLPLGAASPLVAASHRLHLALRPVKRSKVSELVGDRRGLYLAPRPLR